MAILLTRETPCLVQGITGGQGSYHARLMRQYGTRIVAGTTPGRGGSQAEGTPVYDSVAEAVAAHPEIAASAVWVPPRFAADAVLEALAAGIRLVVVVSELIPLHDAIAMRSAADAAGAIVIGGNTPGIITPGQAKLGLAPPIAYSPGQVGVISRSGSLSYETCNSLKLAGLGQSTVVGIGGDRVVGTPMERLLQLFQADPHTDAVVLLGEIGGLYEERAANFIATMTKPVVAFIAGKSAPPGKRMGHQSAIIERGVGTWQSKVAALTAAGAAVVDSPAQVGPRLRTILST
ncbi:MAG: succinate--CoA ligase subunit alpha [Chloroflexi bacterium]|nr:succinate--CoA ligase subunit alpha [Chloroflexota bacterium]